MQPPLQALHVLLGNVWTWLQLRPAAACLCGLSPR